MRTIFQRAVGVPLTTAEMVGPVQGFVVPGGIIAWLLGVILKTLWSIPGPVL